ncbi:efflux RND transporter periplasmic adaptor subunit [Ramlibacter algicola]|uniref:Efflux RND transporter periplasmic adaptor subunit n=1 Tax=Ramlibacter algicola TaxID=2795217 RepID=A0A934UPM8_9BURK|nr:efflux RND transporter periplasmic adaptor subunit [Ramlibacter algicola]MBK0391255.1 efflux RND transporter periplasmic adaptor subunit [Ramlibacter algicola]
MNRPLPFAFRTATLAAFAALCACGGGKAAPEDNGAVAPKTAASGARPTLTVATVAPERASLPVVLAANGSLAAWQEASIGAETNGQRLAEVLVNVGDSVKKGQVLATFSTATLSAELAQARASVAEAEAAAADAAVNAERAKTLEQTGALSASQINQYLTGAKTAQARLQAAQAAEQAQSARLAQSRVLAPDDGVISARTATVGAVVGAGTELFRMIRQGRLEWRAEVTSTELGRVTPGTTAQITAASGARLEGRVRNIGAAVDPQSRMALVYVDVRALPGPMAGSARAGMFARGEFQLGATPALTVPQTAVVLREGFSYLMRVDAQQRIQQLKVRTGRIVGPRIEVLEGLPDDARVVASGGAFLNDGDLVRVVNAPAAPASAASAHRK